MKNLGLIYKFTNIINNKIYIGKSMKYRFNYRMHQHQYELGNTHFDRAKKKYGFENFKLEIVEDNIPKEKLSEREIYWIKYYDSFKNGYNSTSGGEGGNTYANKTEEEMKIIKSKISKANSGKNNGIAKNPELVRGKNNGMYGKKPHNAKTIYLLNIETNEIKEFDRAYKAANFLGFKSGSKITSMIKNKNIVNGYKVVESVETIERVDNN